MISAAKGLVQLPGEGAQVWRRRTLGWGASHWTGSRRKEATSPAEGRAGGRKRSRWWRARHWKFKCLGDDCQVRKGEVNGLKSSFKGRQKEKADWRRPRGKRRREWSPHRGLAVEEGAEKSHRTRTLSFLFSPFVMGKKSKTCFQGKNQGKISPSQMPVTKYLVCLNGKLRCNRMVYLV